MLLAGKKNTVLKSAIPQEITCPKCNSINTTKILVIGTYKHLAQIPFFSGKKYGKSLCTNCNKSFELHHMPNALKLVYYELKENTKTPLWFYTGIIIVKIVVLIKIFSRYF